MEKFYRLIIYLLLLIIPFFPTQFDSRIYYLVIGGSVLLLPLFLQLFIEFIVKKDLLTWVLLLMVVFSIISTYYSINWYFSILTLGLYFSGFIIFTTCRELFKTINHQKKLGWILIGESVILSLISLFNTLILGIVNKDNHGTSFMWIYSGHNHLASLLLAAIPLCGFLLSGVKLKSKLGMVWLIGFFVLIVSMFFTFARGAWISLFLAVLSVGILIRLNKKIFLGLAVVAVVAVLIFIQSAAFNSRLFNTQKSYLMFEKRLNYWQAALDNGKDHFWTGSGLNSFYFVSLRESSNGKGATYRAHNFLLEMFSDGGVGLLVTWMLFLGAAFVKMLNLIESGMSSPKRTYWQLAVFVGVLGEFINGMMDYDLQIPIILVLFFILIGFLIPKDQRLGNSV